MADAATSGSGWIGELAEFLRVQPGVSAVRIDPSSHRVAVATVGNIVIEGLEEKLAATIAAVEAQLEAKGALRAPAGFSVRQEGDAFGCAVKLAAIDQTARPCENRCNRVGRGGFALLMLAIVACDGAVYSLGLYRLAVWRH